MILGVNGKLYYLTTGTRATWGTTTNGITTGSAPASLAEINLVGDVKVPNSDDEIEVKIRRNAGNKAYVPGLTELAPEFEILYEPADTAYLALEKAHVTKGTIALAVLDGDKATSGTKGFWADFHITGWEKTEDADGVQMVAIKAKPAAGSSVAPERVKVT